MVDGVCTRCGSWCSSQEIKFDIVVWIMVVRDGVRVCRGIDVSSQRSGDKIEQEEGEQGQVG